MVAFNQFYDYLSLRGLLFDSQYGFRKDHSVEMADLEPIYRIRHEIYQKRFLVSF